MSARKRIRAALKARETWFRSNRRRVPDDITTYEGHSLLASDIEQILAENRELRAAQRQAISMLWRYIPEDVTYTLQGGIKWLGVECGKLNTRLAAAQMQRPAPQTEVEKAEIEALKIAAENLLKDYPEVQRDGLAHGLHVLRKQLMQERPATAIPQDVSHEIAGIMEDMSILYDPEATVTHLRRIRAALRGRLERIRHLEAENGKLKGRIPTDELAHAISERNAYKQALQTCARVASGTEPLREVPTPDNLQALVCLELSRLHTIEEEIRGILA